MTYPFSGGAVDIRVDVTGEIFKSDSIGPVLDELFKWTVGHVGDLVSGLNDLANDPRFEDRGSSRTDIDSRHTFNGNTLDITLSIELTAGVPSRAIESLTARHVIGHVAEQFSDILADKLAEGSLDAPFRDLIGGRVS